MSANSNNTAISRGFGKLRVNTDKIIGEGMIEVLEWGVAECFKQHDPKHQMHLTVGDAYGYALVHDGKEVARRIWNEGQTAYSNANEALSRVVSERGGMSDWVGIVLAGMTAKGPRYFQISAEKKFMYGALNVMKSSPSTFKKIFKRI